ncbi:MAG TPA: MipA/OmpV family protein, partial [Burkholderiales bacterium]
MKAVSALVVCALLSARALAQSPSIELLDSSYRADGAIDREVEAGRPKLRAALGAGFGIAPRFEGSDQYRGRVVPVLHLAYGPFFFGAGGVGANFYRDPRWRLGASLSLGGGRRESDQLRLQGLGDVDRTVLGGIFAVYANRGLLARAHLATDIGGNGQGTVVRLDTYGRMPL